MQLLPNTNGTRYFHTAPDLWLRIDDTDYPISGATCSFTQNSIPTCTVSIPVGTDADTGKRLALPSPRSNVAGIGSVTTMLQRAKVMMSLRGDAVPSGTWPREDITLFDGAIVGRGHTRAGSQLSVSIQLIHWLYQVDSASALSGATHPGGATDATFRAVFGNSSGLARAAFISDNYPDAALLDAQGIISDIWAKGLQPLFKQMTAENSVWLSDVNTVCGEQITTGNAAAAEALARMIGSSRAVPLTLGATDEAGAIAGKLTSWLQGRINETIVTSSLWEKLVGEIAPGLMFSVIPRVDDALVVPQQMACRSTWKSLYYDDAQSLQTFRGSRRPLRGVLAFAQGSDRSALTSGDAVVPGACFLPEDAAAGLLMHTVAPHWMTGLSLSLAKPSDTSMSRRGRGSATSLPRTPDADAAAQRQKASETEGDYYRRYAEWVYYTEALRGAHCRIGGPLRFDICPGSTIVLEPLTKSTTPDDVLESYVAYVVGLTISINVESLTAETTFELSHLRTVDENENGRFSSDTHAIYDKLFVGAPLIESLNFE